MTCKRKCGVEKMGREGVLMNRKRSKCLSPCPKVKEGGFSQLGFICGNASLSH